MKVMGFNFTKYNVERNSASFKGIKITTGVDIVDVGHVKNEITKEKTDFLSVQFKFNVDYEKKAKIELEGNVLTSMDSKEAKNILKQWKDKKLPDEFKLPILNLILRKSDIKALEFEDEMNLPSHIQMRTLKPNSN